MTTKIEIYEDALGQWRTRIKAGNGEIIFASSEAYATREGAEKNVRDIADALIQGFHFERVEG